MGKTEDGMNKRPLQKRDLDFLPEALQDLYPKMNRVDDREWERLVESALLLKATGYRYREVTQQRDKKEEEKGLVEDKVVVKEVLSDFQAIKLYLTRRYPERWGEAEAEEGLDRYSDQQLEQMERELLEQLTGEKRDGQAESE